MKLRECLLWALILLGVMTLTTAVNWWVGTATQASGMRARNERRELRQRVDELERMLRE